MQGIIQNNKETCCIDWRKVWTSFCVLKKEEHCLVPDAGNGEPSTSLPLNHPRVVWDQLPSPPALTLAETVALPCDHLTGLVWPERGHHGSAQ